MVAKLKVDQLETVDGTGIITANNQLTVNNQLTATSFAGDGSNLTALNATNLDSGTVPTARLGTGTADADSFLRGDGAWASAAAGLKSFQTFTSSGTWTKPSGITLIKVYCTGGGGSGCNTPGGGGAGGGTAIVYVNVSAISSETVTIGSGGAGASAGGSGGTSSFGSHCSATGGGTGAPESGGGFYPGDPGIGQGGHLNMSGQGGTTNKADRGGASYWGAGGKGSRNDTTYSWGSAGGGYGGGGGGGNANGTGGSGGGGIVVVEEYK